MLGVCDVTAFSASPDRETEARTLAASHFINSGDPEAIAKTANTSNIILSTVAADLDWNDYTSILRPKRRLHFVGVTPNPSSSMVFPIIMGQKLILGSPLSSQLRSPRC
jgi:alcohol/geraniol dehydrogenase (NADP+)